MTRKLIIMAGLLTILTFPLHGMAAEKGDGGRKTFDNLELLGTVMEQILSDYVDTVDEEKLIEAAINGMLSSLDPHSRFYNKKQYDEMRVGTSGKFGGLGISVTKDKGAIHVITPIDDTPAFRAGIKSGDYITHIDDKPVVDMNLSQAVDLMRGEVNTSVRLTIIRKDVKPFDVTITRAIIKVKSVKARIIDDVGYVRISTFSSQTYVGLKAAMDKFDTQKEVKLKGYVIDLRNNGGGLLDEGIKVSDAFLNKGEVVSIRPRNKNDIQRFDARDGDLAHGLPVVVLVNEGTASASEIVAGALQDHQRALIVGTLTYGKGSVQTVMPLRGQRAVKMTTSRYYTPSGKSIQAVGINPDIEVGQAKVQDINNGRAMKESDRVTALKNENGAAPKPDKAAQPVENAKSLAATDYQLSRAIDLIKGLSIFKQSMVQ